MDGDLVRRMSDPAFVLALLVATLYFAGWTFYDAYFLRLGLNPAGFGFASTAVGVKGASAMLVMLAGYIGSILPVVISCLVLLVIALILRRFGIDRLSRDGPPWLSPLGRLAVSAIAIAFATMVVLIAGPYAGREKAREELALVASGGGWNYHLRSGAGVVRGLPIFQNDQRVWLLTRAGVRPIKVDDILLQSGPLLQNANPAR